VARLRHITADDIDEVIEGLATIMRDRLPPSGLSQGGVAESGHMGGPAPFRPE